jgi:tripartite-type tricarboxylate transporter receptor subunit TctC
VNQILISRRTLGAVAVASTLSSLVGTARAEQYPSKPIRMIVPNDPGGSVDISARIVLPRMGQLLGQTFVVDNRPGAGGHIGAAQAARAAPDGYTLLCSSGSVLLSGVYRNLPYDPINDFRPIGMLVTAGFVLVVPASSPHKTLQQLIDFGRANPGKLSFGSSGTGNSTHIGAEMLSMMTGMKTVHVPYKGSVGALTDLVGGRIDFMIDNKASSMAQLKSGATLALGVTPLKRLPELPDVPAIGEIVPGFQLEGWNGLFAPKATSTAIVEQVSAALKTALAEPAVAQAMADAVGDARYLGPAETAQYMEGDHERLSKVVKAANIVVG